MNTELKELALLLAFAFVPRLKPADAFAVARSLWLPELPER